VDPVPRRLGAPWLPSVLLTALVFGLYGRSLVFPVVYWDDTQYIFDDVRVQALSLENLVRIVTESYFSNYHPLTTLTYAMDHLLWGSWLPGFHLTHLVLYAAGVVLLYYLFRRLLGNAGWALMGAVLYAVHSIHVEPVVWLAQRKDLLCLVFYVATILMWTHYREVAEPRARRFRYGWTLALAVCAMLSKGYAVVLPMVLLVYELLCRRRRLKDGLLEQLPLILVAAAVTLATVASQETALAESGGESLTGVARFILLAKVFAAYVGRALLPIGLSVHYPVGEEWLSGGVAFLGVAFLVAAVVGIVRLRHNLAVVAFGMVLFLLPLLTVMNLFWTLPTWMNDRYLFFPTMGSCLGLSGAAMWLEARRPQWRTGILVGGGAVVVLYVLLTFSRVGVWRNEVELWSNALRHNLSLAGDGPIAAADLPEKVPQTSARSLIFVAKAYSRLGEQQMASAILERLGKRPPLSGLGFTDIETLARDAIHHGRFQDAVQLAEQAANVSPSRRVRARILAGLAWEKSGDGVRARQAYEEAAGAAQSGSDDEISARLSLGSLGFFAGDYQLAAQQYERAMKAAPANDPRPIFYLGLALEKLGEHQRAYQLYERALAMRGQTGPDIRLSFSDVRKQMALAAEALGRLEEAFSILENVIKDDPQHSEILNMRLKLGQLAEALGRTERAVREYQFVLQQAPDHPDAVAIRTRVSLLQRN